VSLTFLHRRICRYLISSPPAAPWIPAVLDGHVDFPPAIPYNVVCI
jgi:hypothetical protein